MIDFICKLGHVCTSGCQNDFDCPCLAKHKCLELAQAQQDKILADNEADRMDMDDGYDDNYEESNTLESMIG